MSTPASTDNAPVGPPSWLVAPPRPVDRSTGSVTATSRPSERRSVARVLMTADALCGLVTLAVVAQVAPWIASGDPDPIGRQFVFVLTAWVALLVSLSAKRVYARARRRIAPAASDDVGALSAAVVTAGLLVLAADALLGSRVRPDLPPAAVLTGFAAVAAVLPLARIALVGLHGRSLARPARVVIVGTGTVAADVAGRLGRSRHVDLVGFVDDDPLEGDEVLGNLDALPAICRREGVDRVVVTFSRSHPGRTADVLRQVPSTVAIDVVPRYFELTGWQAVLDDFSGLAVVSLAGGPPGSLGRVAKRAFDVVGATIGLVLGAPLLVPALVAIRLTSPGPALFRQERLGRGRRPFRIYKLRTMREQKTDQPLERWAPGPRPVSAVEEDFRRVTPVGAFLRRLGIDELPQLLNVLLGEMSLVGPRPFVASECLSLPEWAERRFDVRPGMTGLWQVCGQHDLRFDELCRLDAQYVTTWSFSSDLRIIVRTPSRLLRGEGEGGHRARRWSAG